MIDLSKFFLDKIYSTCLELLRKYPCVIKETVVKLLLCCHYEYLAPFHLRKRVIAVVVVIAKKGKTNQALATIEKNSNHFHHSTALTGSRPNLIYM